MGNKKPLQKEQISPAKQGGNLRKNKNLKNEPLTYAQKQNRRQKITKSLFFGVIAVVVGLFGWVGYEWYDENYKPMHQVVVDVNGTKFDMTYYIDMMDYLSGGNTDYLQYFVNYAISDTEYFELVKQEAKALGYTVTNDEIAAEIKKLGYADKQPVRDAVRASLLRTKLKAEFFNSLVPQSAEQNKVMAMFLESEAQAADVKTRIEAGETFADIASELSLDNTTQTDKGDIGWVPGGVISDSLGTSLLDDFIPKAEIGVLSTAVDEAKRKGVGYWLLKVTANDKEAVTATVQAMLLSSEAEAKDVLAKINTGEDFVALAEAYSQTGDATKGSELTVAKGDYSDVFEAYALDPDVEIGAVSGIIRDTEKNTSGGCWLYTVTDRGIQDVSSANRTILIDAALDKWVNDLDYSNVTEYADETMRTFAYLMLSTRIAKNQ